MIDHRFFLVALGVALFFTVVPFAFAVDTRAIDTVRDKEILNDVDFQVIDAFVGDSLFELVETIDLSSLAEIRKTLVSRSRSNKPSAQVQYSQRFYEAVEKYIPLAFEKAALVNNPQKKFLLVLNLLILTDQLQDVDLLPQVLNYISADNMAIRYWAVHCIANEQVLKKLNAPENKELLGQIIDRLDKIINDSSFEVIEQVANITAGLNLPAAEQLLLRLADARIKHYEDWTVDNELADIPVLQALTTKLTGQATPDPLLARRFAQLYSYLLQRYIKVATSRNTSAVPDKASLITALVEVEKKCLTELLEKPQSAIKNAIERGDITRLKAIHDKLLGTATQAGELMLKLGLDYGRNADGTKRTAPRLLPDPPIAEAAVSD